MLEAIAVPRLSFQSPSMISSEADEIDKRSIAWVEQHSMLHRPDQFDRLRRAKLGYLSARTYPLAPPDVLRVLSDWHIWLFALDDGYCDESDFGARPLDMVQMAARLMQIVDSPAEVIPQGAGRCASALHDVRERLEKHTSGPQLGRWIAAVHDYLFGIVWESANRAQGTIPSLTDYIPLRRSAGAVTSCLTLIDTANSTEITATEWASPRLQYLTKTAANLIAWDNDIVSYNKERTDHGAMHNLVTVLAAERSCSPAEAVAAALELRQAEVIKFAEIEADVRLSNSDAAHSYVTGLKHWIKGFLDYAYGSYRYLSSSGLPL
jgi:hypothetical protein